MKGRRPERRGVRGQVLAWLKFHKKNQDWLAAKLGIKPSHMSMVLLGRRAPSLKVAARLEALTGIRAALFSDEGRP